MRRGFLDYVGTSAHIFTPCRRKKQIFSSPFFFFKKPRGKSRPVVDSCARLIRLIRFFSDKAPSLTRVDAHPLFAPCSLMGENETVYSPRRVAASHSRRLCRALTHRLMDRISALSHKPCFPPVFFSPFPLPETFSFLPSEASAG